MNRTVVVTGASGFVGAHLARYLAGQGREVIAVGGKNSVPREIAEVCRLVGQADLAEPDACDALCSLLKPAVIVHAAALANVSKCQADAKSADRSNIQATANLLQALDKHRERSSPPLFVHISTDMVFDGAVSAPAGGFSESSNTDPASVYSSTKRDAENVVLASALDAIVLRTALVYGKKIEKLESFLGWVVNGLKSGQVSLFEDEFRTPVAVDDLAEAVSRLIDLPAGSRASAVKQSDKAAILHMSGSERISRVDLGRKIADAFDLDRSAIVPCSRTSVPSEVPRPHDISLNSTKLFKLLGMQPRPIAEGLASIT